VTPTESAGFDLIVVADDGGELHIPASAEEVADLSADWTIAAAPLDEGDDEDDLPLAAAAPAGATMAGYFQSLLSWMPGPAAAETPSYEASVDGSGTLTIAPAADLDAGAGDASSAFDTGVDELGFGAADEPPAQADALAEPGFPAIEPPVDEPSPIDAYLAGADTAPLDEPAAADEPTSIDAYLAGAETAPLEEPAAVDGLGFAEAGTDAVIDAPAAVDDEPWAFPGDVPVAGPPVEEPEPEPAAQLEPLDLDEPWAAPAAPTPPPVDLEAFTLSDELTGTRSAGRTPAAQEPAQADDEGLLPWELPAEPAEPAAAAPAGGFSFEDFFAGSAPAAPAAAAPEPAPAPAPAPLPTSFPALDPGPYTPPPSAFAPPTPPPAAPSAPAQAAGAQEEDDEDLESFQAWLQSLKR
jgi:hypothetical protein